MRVYYILIILILPLCANAQKSVPAEKWDSMVAADMEQTVTKKEADEIADDSVLAAAADKAVQEHYLWDQAAPVIADTIESYADYPLVVRSVPDTMMKVLQADKKLQYALKKKEPPRRSGWNDFLNAVFNFIAAIHKLIIAIVVACLGWLLYLYLKQNGYLFRKTSDDAGKVVKIMEEEQDVETYQQQIEEAIAAGRFRQAVRLLYLQTLRVLIDKEVVTYSREKTNAAYLRSMLSTPWYKKFAALTLNYEYIWYGEAPVNNQQFNDLHREFRQFMNELGYTR
ncbi:DUF4129 domain-containing protein [Chitinophaga pinensis]|nr:DUF4129 domain-containing protein [Chitinophaga pinensis]